MRENASAKELRTYYAIKYDREDLGVIDEADALPGWKGFQCLDGGYTRSGSGGTCRPVLAGLFTDTEYRTNPTTARCTGRAAEVHLSRWSLHYGRPVDDTRFPRCRPAPSWGCPAQCGVYSFVFLDDDGYGVPAAATALTRSWGRVIRGEDRNTGEAWRAEHCRIEHLFIAEKFSTIRTKGDARRGFERRYRCPVTVVPGGDEHGLIPMAGYLDAAEALHLPAIRPSETP